MSDSDSDSDEDPFFSHIKNYIVMPKYGDSLQGSKLTPKSLINAGIQMLEQIQEIHGLGYTHNEINEKNVVMDGQKVRIVGFGQA